MELYNSVGSSLCCSSFPTKLPNDDVRVEATLSLQFCMGWQLLLHSMHLFRQVIWLHMRQHQSFRCFLFTFESDRKTWSSSNMSCEPSEVCRKILRIEDMDTWKRSVGYKDYLAFVKMINDMAKGAHDAFWDPDTVSHPLLTTVRSLLERLVSRVESIRPFEDDRNQRFGNKAYRIWFDQMKEDVENYLSEHHPNPKGQELKYYLLDSFGNQQRIDYGTGHEMNFAIFLMGLYQMLQSSESSSRDDAKRICHEMLTIFASVYMPLVRKVQSEYTLEPAGSHGVFSLDDFQFLPFLWGSSQLVAHATIEPSNFSEVEVAQTYGDKFMFHAAIRYIHQVKRGPFAEHSNQLWNISGVENWTKINRGLFKMYCDEVLHKFPIVQHLMFGQHVLRWWCDGGFSWLKNNFTDCGTIILSS